MAIGIASNSKFVRPVEFLFNGIKCLVNKDTNLDYLYRDYSNSWTMGWKTIGPNCPVEYDEKTQAKMTKLIKSNEVKAKKKAEEYRKKEAAEKAIFSEKVKDIILELKDVDGWNQYRESNKESYGNATLDYAEGWAKLMQVEISEGKKLTDIAEKTSFELGFMGISGLMYGLAVNILSKCWIHGEELNMWHNKKYNYEGEGVVNPAILDVNVPE